MSEIKESYFIGEITDGAVEEEATRQLEDLGLEWKDLEGKRILEIGARWAIIGKVAKNKGIECTSLDIKVPEDAMKGIQYIQADATTLPFQDKSFDLIFSRAAPPALPAGKAEHSPKEGRWVAREIGIQRVIQEVLRVLKKEGEFRFYPGPLKYIFNLPSYKERFSSNERLYLRYGNLENLKDERDEPKSQKRTMLEKLIKDKLGITLRDLQQKLKDITEEEKQSANDKIEKISLEFLRRICPSVTQNKAKGGRIFYTLKKE